MNSISPYKFNNILKVIFKHANYNNPLRPLPQLIQAKERTHDIAHYNAGKSNQ